MKNITKELIEQTILEVNTKMTPTIHEEFLDKIKSLPEEYQNNPLSYYQLAIAIAQGNCNRILEEVLIKLLVD